jgi:hypothetical protein
MFDLVEKTFNTFIAPIIPAFPRRQEKTVRHTVMICVNHIISYEIAALCKVTLADLNTLAISAMTIGTEVSQLIVPTGEYLSRAEPVHLPSYL